MSTTPTEDKRLRDEDHRFCVIPCTFHCECDRRRKLQRPPPLDLEGLWLVLNISGHAYCFSRASSFLHLLRIKIGPHSTALNPLSSPSPRAALSPDAVFCFTARWLGLRK
ncbi:hypothetical protein CEXT_703131 [Caerostris extrusa]|uniref:Uncharacterized protein n=1 Tax=Caerostris extrusa TaxID=172846 RepID=A0AAV4XXQ2_CAEEX|nr:hypothetical protein CEXT_703131 [Caerostris extrusa]